MKLKTSLEKQLKTMLDAELKAQIYYIREADGKIRTCDVIEWAAWCETADRKVCETSFVAKDRSDKTFVISTVFTGTSSKESPLIFETWIFEDGDKSSAVLLRGYSTEAEAKLGHKIEEDNFIKREGDKEDCMYEPTATVAALSEDELMAKRDFNDALKNL